MLSNDQLQIADFHNIPLNIVKKLVSKFFDKDRYALHYNII